MHNRISRSSLVVVLVSTVAGVAHASPLDLDVYESFEGIDPNTVPNVSFSIGPAATEATFSGNAFAGVAGIGSLYHQALTPGVRAWMIQPGSVGAVDFEVDAAEVEFFARTHPSADGNTVITAFLENQPVGSPVSLTTVDGWTLVSFGSAVDRIEFDNQATNFMNGVDDFGYTPVPEPSTAVLALLGVALTALVLRSSKRRQL